MTSKENERQHRALLEVTGKWGNAASPKVLENYKKYMGVDKARCNTVLDKIDELKAVADNVVKHMYDFELKETDDENEAKYLIIETPLVNGREQQLCFAYGKDNTNSKMKLFYVSYLERCRQQMVAGIKDSDCNTKEKCDESTTTLVNEIMKQLMFKEQYEYKRVYSVLKCIKARIQHNINNGNNNGYKINSEKTRIVFNTGLLDSFGNYIIVIAKVCGRDIGEAHVANSMIEMNREGFDNIELEPVKLYDDKNELIFDFESKNIDMGLNSGMGHIRERMDRFPEEFKGASEKRVYDAIKNSIDFDIKMQSRDSRWILPFYNLEFDQIQYLMPLYIQSEYTSKADLVLIVRKYNGICRLATIIDIEQAAYNAMALTDTKCRWM